MLVIGCDFHPSWQQVCSVDTMTGETEGEEVGSWFGRGRAFLSAAFRAGADRHRNEPGTISGFWRW